MNKILKIIFVNILIVFMFLGVNVYATEIPENEIVIPEEWRRDVTENDMYYVTDLDSVNHSIDKNVFHISEEEYKLNGKDVLGDMYIISDEVELIDSKIIGNIFVITDNLKLKNVDIEGSIYILSENVDLEESYVRNTIYMISENTTINSVESTINDMYAISNKMIFKGIILRDVCFYSQFLDIQSGTKINGDLSYPSDIDAIIDEDVVVLKNTKTFEINKEEKIKENFMPMADGILIFLSFIGYGIVLTCLLVFSNKFMNYVKGENFLLYFVKTILLGVISMIVILAIFLIICITIIGIPVALILLLNMVFIAYLSIPIVALSIAAIYSKNKGELYIKGLGVLIVLILLSKIPSVTGDICSSTIMLLCFGTLFGMIFNKTDKNSNEDKDDKNVIKVQLLDKYEKQENSSYDNMDILNRIDEIEDEN